MEGVNEEGKGGEWFEEGVDGFVEGALETGGCPGEVCGEFFEVVEVLAYKGVACDDCDFVADGEVEFAGVVGDVLEAEEVVDGVLWGFVFEVFDVGVLCFGVVDVYGSVNSE